MLPTETRGFDRVVLASMAAARLSGDKGFGVSGGGFIMRRLRVVAFNRLIAISRSSGMER